MLNSERETVNNHNYKLSVIVPIYNIERYLSKCLDSIINQSYKDLDIICVDDGSTDSSGIIADEYAQKDARIRVIHQNNRGLVATRKIGANNCLGDYVINIDGDDWIETDYFNDFMKYTKGQEVDCIWSTGYLKEYTDYSFHKVCSPYKNHEDIIDALYERSKGAKMVSQSLTGIVVRRELYCKVQLSMNDLISQQEDLSFCTRLLCCNPVIKFVENLKYHYVVRHESMSHNNTGVRKGSDEMMLVDNIIFLNENKSDYDLIRKILINYTRLKLLHDFSGLQSYKESIALFPFPGINKKDKVVVFGAGPFGKNVATYINNSHDLELVCWVDTYRGGCSEEGIIISNPKELLNRNYDKVLIAILGEILVNEVFNWLVNNGVESEKIVRDEVLLLEEYANEYYLLNYNE